MVQMDDETKLLFVDTFSKLMIAAFSMVAALAWNAAIQQAILDWLGPGNGTLALVVYAVIVTVVAVIAIIMITRSFNKLNKKIQEDKK